MTSTPTDSDSGSSGLAYDLAGWTHDDRQSLHFRLHESGVDPRWQGTTLVVPAAARGDVDRHIAYMTSGPTAAASEHSASPSTPAPPVAPPPGWYDDPWGQHPLRWWDGRDWTGYTGPPPPERRWLPPRRADDDTPGLRGGGLALAGFVAAEVLAIGLGLLAIALGASRHSITVLVVSELGVWAGLLTPCFLAVRRHGHGSLSELGFRRLRWRDVGPGLVVALIARVGTVVLVAPLIPLLPKRTVRTNGFETDLHRSVLTVVLVVLIITVGAPLVEETFFRGLVQSVFTRRWGARVAVFAQAGCFALVHYQVGMTAWDVLITFVTIGVTGVLLGMVRWHYERLGPGMVAHAAFNAVAVVVILLLT